MPGATSVPSSVESAAIATDRAFFDALLAGDAARAGALLTDDFVMVDVAGGSVIPRSALLAALGSVLVFEAIVAEPPIVRVYGDAAVVVGATRMRFRFAGAASVEVHSRYTHVFVGGAKELRLASAQGTPIAPTADRGRPRT